MDASGKGPSLYLPASGGTGCFLGCICIAANFAFLIAWWAQRPQIRARTSPRLSRAATWGEVTLGA